MAPPPRVKPAPPVIDIQYVDLDFSPGIWADVHAAAGLKNAPSGAATVNTYGCYSPSSGGLAPLPRASTDTTNDQWTLTPADIVNHGTVTRPGYLPATNDAARGYGRMYLMDARLHGPIMPIIAAGTGTPATDAAVALYGFLYDSAGTSGGTSYPRTESFVYHIPGASTHANTQNLSLTETGALIVGPGSVDITTAHPSDYTAVVVATLGSFYHGNSNFAQLYTLPNTSSTTSRTPWIDDFTAGSGVTGKLAPFWLFTHQGRTIFITEDGTSYDFTDLAQSSGAERIYYTNVFDAHPSTIGGPVILSEENPSGYGAWASLNANEALFIKHRGGGVVVRGDIANPTVIRLPGIQSTNGTHCVGCSVPGIGYVYGTCVGVFAWEEQDASTPISEQLPPTFWINDRNWTGATTGIAARTVPATVNTSVYGHYSLTGRFAYSYPYVFAPNSWVYDTRTKAWWQLIDPSTGVQYTHWDTSARACKVAGFKAYIDDTHTLAMQVFNLDEGCDIYYYESQPIVPSRQRYVEIREVLFTVVGNNNCTFHVVITGRDRTGTPISETVPLTTLATDQIEVYRCTVGGMIATQVQVQITANAHDVNAAAPRVLAMSIGYKLAAQVG